MGYDLYFQAGPGKKLDKKSFAAYFKGRRHYQVKKGQALYQNEDTGVYFIFDEPEDGVAVCALNYFRPHVFGLEAAVEFEAFAVAFEATVGDPQDDSGDEELRFERERFLRAWNHGNRLAYRSMIKEQEEDGPMHAWPAERIRAVWEWNYARPPEEDWAERNVFVPGIFAVEEGGEVLSVAIWPPECAILLPAVDALLVPCQQSGKESEDTALVKWDEVLPVVKPYEEVGTGLARYRLEFENWPPDVAEFLGRQREAVGQMKGVGLDEILDKELVEEARAG